MDPSKTVYKVRIIDGQHPHYNETGTVTFVYGQIATVNNMFPVELDNCPLMVDKCYAGREQLEILRPEYRAERRGE